MVPHDTSVIDGQGREGATGVQRLNGFGGFCFLLSLKFIEMDVVILHAQLVQELLGFPAPDAGAQSIEDDLPLFCPAT